MPTLYNIYVYILHRIIYVYIYIYVCVCIYVYICTQYVYSIYVYTCVYIHVCRICTLFSMYTSHINVLCEQALALRHSLPLLPARVRRATRGPSARWNGPSRRSCDPLSLALALAGAQHPFPPALVVLSVEFPALHRQEINYEQRRF